MREEGTCYMNHLTDYKLVTDQFKMNSSCQKTPLPKASGVERRLATLHVNILLIESKIFKSIEYIRPQNSLLTNSISLCPINATPSHPD